MGHLVAKLTKSVGSEGDRELLLLVAGNLVNKTKFISGNS